MKRGRPRWCVHPKCLGFETQGVYATVADRLGARFKASATGKSPPMHDESKKTRLAAGLKITLRTWMGLPSPIAQGQPRPGISGHCFELHPDYP